jgi:Type IV secretion-system coupling protein DNA-binding domain
VPKVGSYTLLVVVTRTGSRLAVDSDVTEGSEYAFALTEQAIKAGAVTVEWQSHGYENSRLHAFLRHSIYHDQTLDDLAKLPLFGGFSAFLVCLMVAIPKDVARARARKNGRRLKGPELVTAAPFNRRNRADGIGFLQERSFTERLIGRKRQVRIPRAVESSHILIMGDTGIGKSVLTRRILMQIEERGETAIVYDDCLRPGSRIHTAVPKSIAW